jgi:hypothetical protein
MSTGFKFQRVVVLGVILMLSSAYVLAQDFEQLEDEIAMQAMIVQKGRSDSIRLAAHERMIALFDSTLSLPGSFKYSYSKLTTISFLTPEDQSFRIVTWVVPLLDRTYRFGGLIQRKTDSIPAVNVLYEPTEPIDFITERELRTDEWYGCLYYEIKTFKHRKTHYYALVGWDGNNASSNKKYLDVLRFDEKKGWIFGEKIFETKKKKQTRFILEYKEDAGVTLSYNKKEKMFVFDHLIPIDGAPVGMYQYYVPDFSYDGYRFKKGKFILVENIQVTNDERYDLPGGEEP